jgi:hypothetical protein
VIAATASPNSCDQQEGVEDEYNIVYLPHFVAIYTLTMNFLASGADLSELIDYLTGASPPSHSSASPTSTAAIGNDEAGYQAFATKAAFAQIDLAGKGYVTKHDFQEVHTCVHACDLILKSSRFMVSA